ncbi:lysine transporter LysE [Oceanicola sp. 22II-s10i]|uniref:LysE family translocator n=1 Tax=Oceanicola sp. 22II-s10i TaxID=1317116 RepID=UPI000B52169E|nr:LysE family translocator [Oceanicola sp. 22II-s10i]OWU83838.1 lysine transporter LysE [Oceanicola sp. 22II-s10i]
MDAAHLIAFNLTLLAAIASPGPSLLYSIRTTLVHGRRTGLATAMGLVVMAVLWTVAALLGLDALFRLFPALFLALKLFGAAYLIRLAWQTWKHAADPVSPAGGPSTRSAFLNGLLVNLGNPKSVLFAAAVIVVIFPPDLSAADKALIALNQFVVELVVQPAIVLVMSSGAVARRYLALKPRIDRITAGVLGLLAVKVAA